MLRRLVIPIVAVVGVLVVACGGENGGETKPTAFPQSSDPSKNVPANQVGVVNAVVAGSDWFIGENNFVFGITDKSDQPQGGATARATFYDLREPSKPKPVFSVDAVQSAPGVGAKTEHVHAGGETHLHGGQDDDRVGYFVKATFDHAGFWGLAVEATLKDGSKGVSTVSFQVYAKANVVAPGMAAFKSDNLTKADVKNLSEIDSGTPPNDMHDVKIKDSLAKGRPLVIVFSTPAFCTSRFCGPVNEEVEALQAIYKDRVDFVHIEVWRNFDQKLMNPTAREWLIWPDGSLREPIVFVVDKKGTIYDRWEGPVAVNIMDSSVNAVASGATR